MHLAEFILLVIATIAAIAAGLAMVASRLHAAKVCCWIAAITFGSLGIVWSQQTHEYSFMTRATVAAICAAIAAIALVWGLDEIQGRAQAEEAKGATEKQIQPTPGISQKNEGPGQQFNAPGGNIYINPAPSPSPRTMRNPNGIYQLEERVGTAVGANILQSRGIITFQELYGVGELNDQQPFEYQDYVLKFISADGKPSLRGAMTLMGLSISGAVQQNIVPRVVCEITGKKN